MGACPICGSTVIEYDPSEGNSVCTICGYVADENAIVSDVTFGEASTGAAVVEGGYLGANDVRGRMMGPRGRQQSAESREQTLMNGKRQLASLANALNLGDATAEAAHRWYVLAVTNGFVQGRRSIYVLASCLYVACRMGKLPTMLIDISDLLQVNVFILGSTYLRLVKDLHIPNIPLVDPSIYISRFASMLEFGDETQKVAYDATRLVQRFTTDWMSAGRRPAGVAGACLLLAARMNNFRRSILEIVQVVKIADVTLRKRLEEFKATPSGQMTIADFRNVWLEDQADPPAFLEGLKKARAEAEAIAAMASAARDTPSPSRSKERDATGGVDNDAVPIDVRGHRFPESTPTSPSLKRKQPPTHEGEAEGQDETVIEDVITTELHEHLMSTTGACLAHELDQLEEDRRQAANCEENRLDNLDEEELDAFLLDDEEVELKTRVWMEFNKDYLEKLAEKRAREAAGELKPTKPRGKKAKSKPRDSANPTGQTTSEAVHKMMASKKKFSKKINYELAERLFGKASTSPAPPPLDFGEGNNHRAKSTSKHSATSRESTMAAPNKNVVAAEDHDDEDDEEEEEEAEAELVATAEQSEWELMKASHAAVADDSGAGWDEEV